MLELPGPGDCYPHKRVDELLLCNCGRYSRQGWRGLSHLFTPADLVLDLLQRIEVTALRLRQSRINCVYFVIRLHVICVGEVLQ